MPDPVDSDPVDSDPVDSGRAALLATASPEIQLDEHGREILTKRNWRSLWMVLLVQSQNAFNDNVVRFVLVGLAMTAAAGTWLGDHVEELTSFLLALPFILFAPLAGYLTDRFSKRLVMKLCFVAQLLCFLWILLALARGSLIGVVTGFFALGVQSAFFGPAKNGILKEIVGSHRLGMAVGWLQMTLMISILAGIFLGGFWFEAGYRETGDAWEAAMRPILVVASLSLLPLVAMIWLMRTPAHPDVRYRASIWVSHFRDLSFVMRQRTLRLTAIGIGYYWLLASVVGLVVIGAGRELALADSSGVGVDQSALMYGTIGIGLMLGSGLVSACSRQRIELGLVPFGAAGFVIGLLWAGLTPLGSGWFFGSMAFIGFSGAFFMVPLSAFLQDQAANRDRGRVLAASNLLANIAGLSNSLIVLTMKSLGWSVSTQFLVLALPTALVSLYVFRLLPQNALRFALVTLVRTIYRIRRVDHQRVPREGGLLVISNHIGFSDAFLLGASFDRPLRFVMIEKFYRMWWARWFLDLFGAVPITRTRAKEAIRRTAAAAHAGGAVGIFPEGQLSRTGLINGVRPGFQLIARQGGVPVLPVYMDGVWGSIFTGERNRYFRKWPRQLPYPVTVAFGSPQEPRAATCEWAAQEFRKLAAVAFASRPELGHSLRRQWRWALSPLRSPLNLSRAHPAIVNGEGWALGPGGLLRRLRSGHREPFETQLPEEPPSLQALLARLAQSMADDKVPGLRADAAMIAAQVAHLRAVNLLLPGDVMRPVGDWRAPALWMLGVLTPLLGGWTLWLDGDRRKAGNRPTKLAGRRIIEVRATAGGEVELWSRDGDDVEAMDAGAIWPPGRTLCGLAEPESGALVSLSLTEPPTPEEGERQPGWREGSVGKLLPGVMASGGAPDDELLRLSGVPLGDRVWSPGPGAHVDGDGFLFVPFARSSAKGEDRDGDLESRGEGET